MRKRNPLDERTSFQEHGPYDPIIDSKADIAMVYGLDRDFESRMAGWGSAGYRLHVMTGVSWGDYADYVRGEWDGVQHFDDAQTAAGNFRLEHGIAQGHDIYYMMPSMSYVMYLAEKLHRVVDAGALALHLEEPEFWVRAGYEAGFQREWEEFYGEPWQDPASSPDARYRCEKLKQYLYSRALSYLFKDIKQYARAKGNHDFKCYVPTHSLINYAHWRIVSPESQLLQIADCDGIIGQVWTGTSRTPNVYRGVLKQRTFEAGYCEYASCGAMVRDSNRRLWQLADPIEDNPNYCWEDYRRCWESDVTASLLSPDNVRFEIMPWPARVFERAYPKENLDSKPLSVTLDAYLARLEREGRNDLAVDTRLAMAEFARFYHEHRGAIAGETLGFARQADTADELRFGDILAGAFSFYKYLAAKTDQAEAVRLRDAVSAFYHDPTDEREYIPASYAAELQVVFNALADMEWPGEYEWLHGQTGVGIAISDTLMYQRGEPDPSDPDLSSFYGLTMPLIKHGTALAFVHLERLQQVSDRYLSGIRTLILTYEGMKPSSPDYHATLAEWVRRGNGLIIFGNGDAYNGVREWWNQNDMAYAAPQDHLTELLGIGRHPQSGAYACGAGYVLINEASPAALAHRVDGAGMVLDAVKQMCSRLALSWTETHTLAFRRGPYVIAAGMDESIDAPPTILPGCYVDLYDARLAVVDRPVISAGSCHLYYDLARCPQQSWVIAAAGLVTEESASANNLSFKVSGMNQSICAVRVAVPTQPRIASTEVQPCLVTWDEMTHTALLEFANNPHGVAIRLEW